MIQHPIKTSLNIVIAIQLAFMPYYGYAGPERNSVLSTAIQQIKDSAGNNGGQIEQSLLDLSIAIEQGTVLEYLKKNPLTAKEIDYFSLSHQKVEVVEHHYDTEQKKFMESVSQTVILNDNSSRPIDEFASNFKDMRVRYDKESKTLVLEGLSQGVVRLRQYIPDIDMIDSIEEKLGEFLVILDRKKGLLVISLPFAQQYLGLAPVPVHQVPTPVLRTLSELSPQAELTAQDVHVEFIHRGARPPDILVEEIRQEIDKTFTGQDMVFSGDLMISYIGPNGEKHLVQFLKRGEIKSFLHSHYQMLDAMIKTMFPHLMKKADVDMVQKELTELRAEDPKAVVDHILSATVNKVALSKLLLAKDGIAGQIQQHGNQQSLNARDKMTFAEWQSDFEQVTSRLSQKHSESEQRALEHKRQKASFMGTDQVAKILTPITLEEKQTRATGLRLMAGRTAKLIKKIGSVFKHAPVVGSAVVAGGAGVFMSAEVYDILVAKITSIVNKAAFVGDFVGYQLTMLPSLATMLFVLPLVLVGAFSLINPATKLAIKGLEKLDLEQFRVGSKVFHPNGRLKDFLNTWEKRGPYDKALAIGMLIMSFTLRPVWNYGAFLLGQPHFFTAWQKGLKAWEVIDPKSDIGQIMQIKKPVRLGVSSPLDWVKGPSFTERRTLQTLAFGKEYLIKRVAWQLAVLAVAGKEHVTPEQITTYGITGINLEDVKTVYGDETKPLRFEDKELALRMEFMWTRKKLAEEIKLLDEIDIRKVAQELPPELVIRYYEKAKSLAKQAKEHPYFYKKTRDFLNTGRVGAIQNALSLQSIALFNKKEVEIMMQGPSDFVSQRSLTDFLADHALVATMPPFIADRADMSLQGIPDMAVHENAFLYNLPANTVDVFFNAYNWMMISGGMMALAFRRSPPPVKNHYEPLEMYTSKTPDRTQSDAGYFWRQLEVLAPWEEKGTQSNEFSFGNLYFLKFYTKSNIKTIQNLIIMTLIMRVAPGVQTFSEAIMAALFIHMAQFWYLVWPAIIIQGADAVNLTELGKNRAIADKLVALVSQLHRGAYTDREGVINNIKSVIDNGLKIRYSPKQWEAKLKKEPLLSWLYSIDTRTTEAEIKTHYEMLQQKSFLPTKKSKFIDFLWSTVFAAGITTYLGINLFVASYDSKNLSYQNLMEWLAIHIGVLTTAYLGYTKLPQYYQKHKAMLSEDQKSKEWYELPKEWGHILKLVSGTEKARLKAMAEGLADWHKAVRSLKGEDSSWSKAFYNKILNVGSSVGQKCQKAFSKKK